jgi:eukaryotic-like serine/threonine-protein kinase
VDDLDRWTRVLPLGAGAFGEVHLAWDHVDSRWVACKRFTGQDELGLLRMVIESRIRVSHPHLVRTLAFRLVDDRAWLVTELARGGSLRALMTRTGALPWGWVAAAVDQVLAALTALHASGVVHRDLKPANLLLRSVGSSEPHLLVGDFGIATWRTVSMTGIGAAIGTPGYLAPEYLDGHAPSPATDLFAVGVLAAEMLTGRRQVHHSNASPSMPSSWGELLPLPAEVPAGMAAVLRRMAAPDPSRRYLDCAQAREALLSAVPPSARGDLRTVEVPDLLAAVPPGWTPEGPQEPAKADGGPSVPEATGGAPNLVGLPIDGGPTALVPENSATVDSPAPPAAGTGSSDASPDGSATRPAAGPVKPPANPPATPPGGSAIPPRGSTPPARAQRRTARRQSLKRKVRQGTLLLTLVALLAGGGTLWWAATHRDVTGQPSAVGSRPSDSHADWVPTVVEPCAAVELDTPRTGRDGAERCQRTPDRDPPQSWVREPPGGFPKSNAAGPFPGEQCTVDGDRDYSPVGDHVQCDGKAWRLIA